uniref:MHC class II beta chain N-terminal domain-containing protein n=1 Tax=Catharus ustulatus TaxID=91951 RepID=A0A8C3V8S3_CATUS
MWNELLPELPPDPAPGDLNYRTPLLVLGTWEELHMEGCVFQEIVKSECHFINGTDRVRFVKRFIYNREQYVHFDSDVGHFVGDTPYGEKIARYWNSDPEWMEYRRAAVDRHCRHNSELSSPFLVERRGVTGSRVWMATEGREEVWRMLGRLGCI